MSPKNILALMLVLSFSLVSFAQLTPGESHPKKGGGGNNTTQPPQYTPPAPPRSEPQPPQYTPPAPPRSEPQPPRYEPPTPPRSEPQPPRYTEPPRYDEPRYEEPPRYTEPPRYDEPPSYQPPVYHEPTPTNVKKTINLNMLVTNTSLNLSAYAEKLVSFQGWRVRRIEVAVKQVNFEPNQIGLIVNGNYDVTAENVTGLTILKPEQRLFVGEDQVKLFVRGTVFIESITVKLTNE